MNNGKTFVYKIHPNAKLPTYATSGSSGADIYLCEDIEILPGQVKLARTGIAVKPPCGYYYELFIRSSTPLKNPGVVLANGVGIVDSDYSSTSDEIKILLLNVGTKCVKFEAGNRIAQLVLKEVQQPSMIEASEEMFNKSVRGGFGSTDG